MVFVKPGLIEQSNKAKVKKKGETKSFLEIFTSSIKTMLFPLNQTMSH